MKRPSFQFYPGDWQSDLKLRRCSAAARGVWIDILCALHDSDDGYGLLRWPLKEIASTVGANMAHVRELVDKQVLRGSDDGIAEPFVYTPRSGRRVGAPVTLIAKQAGPLWYSKRLVQDDYVRTIRGEGTRFGAAEERESQADPRPAPGDTERARLRARVLDKTDGKCYHCDAALDDRWEVDHLLPRSKGGRHTFANLVPSCTGCNQDKSDTLPDDWQAPKTAPKASPTRRVGEGSGDGSSTPSSSSPSGRNTKPPTVAPALPPEDRPPLALVGTPAEPPKGPPDCPHQAVLALWQEVLPEMPQHLPSQWRGTRAEHLRARWRETAVEKRWTSQQQGLNYLRKLFAYIGQSAFLTGKAAAQPGRKPFVVELEWLVNPSNWAKVHEGKYHGDAA